jgi:hypothetical protein
MPLINLNQTVFQVSAAPTSRLTFEIEAQDLLLPLHKMAHLTMLPCQTLRQFRDPTW